MILCSHPTPPEFENLQKGFLKAKAVVQKEGGTPRFYLRSLTELEDFVKDVRALCSCLIRALF